MSVSDDAADLLLGAPLSRAVQLVRRLLWMYASFAGVMVLMLVVALLPVHGLDKLKGLASETLIGGLGATTLSAVLLALTALIATALLANSRLALRRTEVGAAGRRVGRRAAGPASPAVEAGPGRPGPRRARPWSCPRLP